MMEGTFKPNWPTSGILHLCRDNEKLSEMGYGFKEVKALTELSPYELGEWCYSTGLDWTQLDELVMGGECRACTAEGFPGNTCPIQVAFSGLAREMQQIVPQSGIPASEELSYYLEASRRNPLQTS